MAVYKIYKCDSCGKEIPDNEITIWNGRFVGKDETLMIQISMNEPGYRRPRHRSLIFCPECWGKVIRAVRRVLKLEEKDEGK